MAAILFSTLLLISATFVASHDFETRCKSELSSGLELLENVLHRIAADAATEREESHERVRRQAEDLHARKKRSVKDDPEPTPPYDCPPPWNESVSMQFPGPAEHPRFPRMLPVHSHIDPLVNYATILHKHLSNESACHSSFTNINGITEAQLYGFFSLIATTAPGPFCSLCHRLTEEVHTKVLTPLTFLGSGADLGTARMLSAYIPSAKTICTSLAPGCYEDYETKVANMSAAVTCLECSVCMSALNLVEHKILLNKPLMNKLEKHFETGLFDIACRLICVASPNQPPPLNNIDYPRCMAGAKKLFYKLIEAASQLLRPERMCSLELGWCELNEAPNALHCVRELCEAGLAKVPQLQWICGQIPDRPEEADRFLNVHETKIYKGKKDYHERFERKMQSAIEERKKRSVPEHEL